MRPLGGTPEMLRNRIQSEIDKWRPVVKRTGIALGN
jgi:tripartite-type tricarboxylate transporter receptor subunit TctC